MLTPKPVWAKIRPWDRHGLILSIAGLMYILIGVAYLASDIPIPQSERLPLLEHIMPFEWWYWGFILVGAISIVSSRWPSTTRPLGYATLAGWSSGWAGFHVIGGLTQPVNITYVIGGLMMATLGFLWWAISGLICLPNERGNRGDAAPHCCFGRCVDRGSVCDSYTAERYESNT